MAQVTVELRNLLKLSNFKLFDFDYRFDDLNMKSQIEESIRDFYYTYEINGDTPDEFKHRFKTRFKRKIGYYNELYNTTLFEYNPLINNSTVETTKQINNGVNNATSNSNITANSKASNTSEKTSINKSNNKDSNYPQQSISGGNFLSGEQENNTTTNDNGKDNTNVDSNSTSENTLKNTSTNNIDFERKVEALTGTTYQELIQKERNNIINILDMIIEEMKPCFILVY